MNKLHDGKKEKQYRTRGTVMYLSSQGQELLLQKHTCLRKKNKKREAQRIGTCLKKKNKKREAQRARRGY